MTHIVTLTLNPSIDAATEIDRVEPDIKIRCDRPRRDPGGGGLNVSHAILKLGGRSTAVLTAGGTLGHYLGDLLKKTGIDHRIVDVKAETRENFTVLERGGRQFRFNMPGGPISEAECRACIDLLLALSPPPGYLVLSGSLPDGAPPDFYAVVMKALKERPTRVVLDTSGAALRNAMSGRPFLVKCNRRELGQLRNQTYDSVEDAIAGAKALTAEGATALAVVSMGTDGAVLATMTDHWYVAAPAVQAQSQIGAGDSMVAAMTLALAHDATPRDVLLHGVAAGTAAVLTPGTELVRRSDFKRILVELQDRPIA